MASFLNVRPLLGCLALALGASGLAQHEGGQRDVLVFDFEAVTVDPSTDLFQARRPKIMQGNLSIEADEATGTSIDFSERSEWRFKGGVRITSGTAVLEAAEAVFTFEDERLSRGELSGTPVTFTDFDKVRNTKIEGRAQRIVYDYVASKLRMTGDAWVQRGQTRVLGCDLNYDFAAAERDTGLVVTSASDDCEDRFRILIERDRDEQPAPTDAPQ
jgi:lipopolysaccharide transport protein LptA